MKIGVMELLDDFISAWEQWKCRKFGHKFVPKGQLHPPVIWTGCARLSCDYVANPQPANVTWHGSRCFELADTQSATLSLDKPSTLE